MRKLSTFVDCLLITAVAVAAPTANEDFVVAEDAKTYTNAVNAANAYTDGKIAEIPVPDFSTNNTELVETIEAKAPAPSNYAAVSNAAMNAASRVNPTITNIVTLVGYDNSHWELNGNQTGWYFTDSNGNTYRIEFNSDSEAASNDVGSASNVLLASRKWVYDHHLPKSGGTVTGALTVQENLTVGEGSATGAYSVAEGYGMAEGDYSHAEGHNTRTTVYGIDAHAEGSSTTANGYASHAEGGGTTANGEYSHVEGEDTTAQNDYEHAQGRFNASHRSSVTFGDAGNTLSSIGFGTADNSRTNAVETMQNGKTFIYGLGGYDGTNPTNGVKDLVAAIDGKADAAELQGYLPLDYFKDGQTISMYWGDGTKLCDFGANWLGNLVDTVDDKTDAAEVGDIASASISNIVTAAYINDRVNVTPLAGRTYNFATNIGLYTAVRDIIQALGGSVTNFPAIPQN